MVGEEAPEIELEPENPEVETENGPTKPKRPRKKQSNHHVGEEKAQSEVKSPKEAEAATSNKRRKKGGEPSEVKPKSEATSFARRAPPNTEAGLLKWNGLKTAFNEVIKPHLLHYSKEEDRLGIVVFKLSCPRHAASLVGLDDGRPTSGPLPARSGRAWSSPKTTSLRCLNRWPWSIWQ